MAESTTDPIFNEPMQVVINGHKFAVRELSYRSARHAVFAIHDLILAVKKANPDLKFSQLESTDNVVEAILESLREVLTDASDLMAKIVTEATGLTDDQIDGLPLSLYLLLLGEVVKAQAPVIDAFLSVKQLASETWGNREKAADNGPAPARTAPKPRSSPASRASASGQKKPAS